MKSSPTESEEPLPGRGIRWYVDEEDVERFLGRQLDPLDLPRYAKRELAEAKRTVKRALRDAEGHNGMLSTTTLSQLRELVDRLEALAASSLLAE